jgi:hypothetical protein
MVSQDMVKQAYAEGAYQALKEAGYDDQTAAQIAREMAKQAGGPLAPAPAAAPPPAAMRPFQPKGPAVRQTAPLKPGNVYPTAGADFTRGMGGSVR